MPGRTVDAAFRDFIGPIKSAASCLGKLALSISPGGQSNPKTIHSWVLLGTDGVTSGKWTFSARMSYKFVQDPDGTWRVMSVGYSYGLAYGDQQLWRMDWHPTSLVSPLPYPHIHLSFDKLLPETPAISKEHLPTGRFTFEDAIRWAAAFGFPMVHSDALQRLYLAEKDHLVYRSWGGSQAPDLSDN